MIASIGFVSGIKPYFTAIYRAHMIVKGNKFDLWDPVQVVVEFDNIEQQVGSRQMPPDGEWDDMVKDQFLKDFAAWKAGGFLP